MSSPDGRKRNKDSMTEGPVTSYSVRGGEGRRDPNTIIRLQQPPSHQNNDSSNVTSIFILLLCLRVDCSLTVSSLSKFNNFTIFNWLKKARPH